MAEADLLLRVLFSLANSALLLGVGAFLALVPPVTRAKRLLALYLALLGFGEWAILSILGPGTPGSQAWLDAGEDIGLLRNLVLVSFLWSFPRTPSLRSLHSPAFLVVGGLFLAATLLWFGARDAVAMGSQPATFVYDLARRGGFGLGIPLLLASSMWRARQLRGLEGRGATTLLVFALATHFGVMGTALWSAVSALTVGSEAFDFYWGLRWSWPGDCCHLAAGLDALGHLVLWGMILGLAVRARHHVALGLVGFGLVVHLLPPVPINIFSLLYVWSALGAMYVVLRDGPPSPEVRPWLHDAFAVFGAAVVLFLVVTVTLYVFPDAALALALGIVLGLVLGGAAGLVMHPAGAVRVFPPGLGGSEDTQRRLAAYRTALEAELADGRGSGDISTRLRPLRSQLGISEREHAVMEHTLRAATPGARMAPLEEGGLFLGRYRVQRKLGEGGAAVTYLCRDEQVGRDVVLKRLRAAAPGGEGIASVLREARAIGALKHPNVLTLYDVEQVGDEAFIVMEHAEGGSLAARLVHGALREEEFGPLARDLLAGLEAVHAAGLVHRDVKPSNVLLSGGRAKLGDFGIAHLRGFETTFLPGRDPGAVGTVRFMSPEQARGRACTPQSDLFSAGAALLEAYTGRPYLEPGRDESAVEVQLRAAKGRAFRVDGRMPPALRAWFAKALDPHSASRFASARAMCVSLDHALAAADRGRP